MTVQFADERHAMQRACELAARGIGAVEPNPPVGAVVVDRNLQSLGEGFHESFGDAHAEVNALRQAGANANGATLFVTLEPCCHTGKTPPCTRAVIDAGIKKVVIGMRDPSPHADGQGIAELQRAGIAVEVGLLAADVERLAAPFVKRVTTSLPYVHAKWAMTLDGKIATQSGDSQWISNEASRQKVHTLRGRMDAIIVGLGTAMADDPLLTARPAGPRTAVRIVFDSRAELPLASQLVRTAADVPVLVVAHRSAAAENIAKLTAAGAEVLTFDAADSFQTPLPSGGEGQLQSRRRLKQGEGGERSEKPPSPQTSPKGRGSVENSSTNDEAETVLRPDPRALLEELGRREMTNVLLEGGGQLIGTFFDQQLVDECHVFVAPKIVGGSDSIGPLSGRGVELMAAAMRLIDPQIETIDGDIHIHGPLSKPNVG
jgi:diaminohydroxyphosphoribosylaminopyrimidine deaminase/5-amino-6-(5-phosphoribosylamino)uracil reductase